MRNSIWVKLVMAAAASSLLLTGCGAMSKPIDQSVGASDSKSAVDIPKSFPNEQAKRTWAAGAIADRHFAEAKTVLEETTKAEPNPEGFRLLGTARFATKDYPGAIDAWTHAAELDPSLASQMQNNTGNALRQLKKSDEAKAAYARSLQLDPTFWTAAINLASLLNQEGNRTEAIQVLEQALATNPGTQPLTSLLESYKNPANPS